MKLRHAALLALTVLMTGLVQAPAHAADAVRGAALFANTNGAPLSCGSGTGCHAGFPTTRRNKIANGSNPTLITNAINANTGGMRVLSGYCDTTCAADIAAYIANPAAASAVPAAAVSPASLSFPGTTVGTAATVLTTTLSNTGTGALSISAIALSGAASGDYSTSGSTCAAGGSVAAGGSCTLSVVFTPSTTGARSATLTVTHNATGGSSTVALSGTGNPVPSPSISISNSLLDFASVVLGTQSAAQSITVTNSGTATMTFGSWSVAGSNPSDFARTGGTCSASLAAGASCTVSLAMTPTALGTRSGTLSLTSNASNGSPIVTLTGAGQPVPAPVSSLNTASLAFGTVTIGTNSNQSVTLSNTGNATLNISSVALSGSNTFVINSNNCGSTLAAGATCTVGIRLTPAVASAVSGSLTITDNASGSPRSVSLSGAGTNAPTAAPQWVSSAPLIFSTTNVGQSTAAQTATLTNAGNAAFTPTALTLAGGAAADFVRTGTCAVGVPVAPAASCTVSVAFAPTQAGSRTATLTVATDGGAALSLQLSGQGNVVASISGSAAPSAIDFGTVDVGSPLRRTVQVSNTGTGPLQISSSTIPSGFVLPSSTSVGACTAVPFTLLAGESCALSVEFSPLAAATSSGDLILMTNAPTPELHVGLTGLGQAVSPIASNPAASSSPSAKSPGVTGGSTPLTQTSVSPLAPVNIGAGGCVAGTDQPGDPTLPLLAIVSLSILLTRRRTQASNG